MNWAVLGSSGFVGSRFVEQLHLAGNGGVRPIVRSFSSLARLARFELDWRVNNLTDVSQLAEALKGCEVLLHSIVGDEDVILGTITPVYEAAGLAGIRRIVYLSSSSVHGLAPEPGTTEETPLSDQQPFSYNNAKVRAEKLWTKVCATGGVEFVGLRPSIVFGPRSRWCSTVAQEALEGTAYLLREGTGICNTIYVDNLVQAICAAAEAPAAQVDGRYFFVRDREKVTWSDFYQPMVAALGLDASSIHYLATPAFKRPAPDRLSRLRGSPLVKMIKPLAPRVSIRVAKAALGALPTPQEPSPWLDDRSPRPHVTEEMAALQLCQWQMPCARAEKLLNYHPSVSFAEGMQRSIGWLQFAGVPIPKT